MQMSLVWVCNVHFQPLEVPNGTFIRWNVPYFKLFSSYLVAECNPEAEAGWETGLDNINIGGILAWEIKFANCKQWIGGGLHEVREEAGGHFRVMTGGAFITQRCRDMEKRGGIKDHQELPQRISGLERGKEYCHTATPSSDRQARNELEQRLYQQKINVLWTPSIWAQKNAPPLPGFLTMSATHPEAEVCKQKLTQGQALLWTVW